MIKLLELLNEEDPETWVSNPRIDWKKTLQTNKKNWPRGGANHDVMDAYKKWHIVHKGGISQDEIGKMWTIKRRSKSVKSMPNKWQKIWIKYDRLDRKYLKQFWKDLKGK